MKIAFHLGSTAIQPFILNQILSITDKNIEILILEVLSIIMPLKTLRKLNFT